MKRNVGAALHGGSPLRRSGGSGTIVTILAADPREPLEHHPPFCHRLGASVTRLALADVGRGAR